MLNIWNQTLLVVISSCFGVSLLAASLDSRYETYFSAMATPYMRNATLNSNNNILKLPSSSGEIDFRPDWRLKFSKTHRVVLRPRYLLYSQYYQYGDPILTETMSRGKIDVTDFFFEDQWTSLFTTVVGLQVYQWGPAELLNPSNPLFHFNSRQRTAFYKEKGQAFIRMNLDWNKNWNQVFIAEPITNAEPEWMSEQNFNAKGLLKTEFKSDSSLHYIGFVGGIEEQSKLFGGAYFNITPTDGFSIYADAKQTRGRVSYYPQLNNYGGYSLGRDDITTQWYMLSIAGLRFETSSMDLRLEYVYNEAGFTPTEFEQFLSSVKLLTPDIGRNTARFQKPGLEFLGRHYSYISLRLPNVFDVEDFSLAFRMLSSLQDYSSIFQFNLETALGDAWTFYTEALIPASNKDQTELNLFGQSTYMLGLRWNF